MLALGVVKKFLQINLKRIDDESNTRAEIHEYQCNSCNASFKKEFHLKEHFTYYHDGKNDKPSYASPFLKGADDESNIITKFLADSIQRIDDESNSMTPKPKTKRNLSKKFNCNECGKSFSYKEILMRHIEVVHEMEI